MKHLGLIALNFIALTFVGCSTTGSSVPDAQMETQKYQEKVRPQDARAARRLVACPRDKSWTKESWKTRMTMTNACAGEGQWEKVEELGNFMAQKEPLAPWGTYYLSLAATARKDYSRAMWMIELAIKKSPKEAMLQYHQGKIYWHMQDYAKATKQFEKALSYDPEFHESHVMLGQIYYRDQDYDKAKAHFESVISKDFRNFNALVGRAEIHLKKSEFKEALVDYTRAVTQAPPSLKGPINEKIRSLETKLAQQQPKPATDAVSASREPSQTPKKRVTK